jgi:ATP-dependent RNA circularization protein (DNA/RNA ligase family)
MVLMLYLSFHTGREETFPVTDIISWEVTEKLDGTSLTIFTHNGDDGICSRSWRLSLETRDGELGSNIYAKITERENLLGKLRSLNRNIAAQGELVGPGIQENKYNLTETAFFCFDLFDIDLGQYIDPVTRRQLCEQMGMAHIPVVEQDRFALHAYIHTYMTNIYKTMLCISQGAHPGGHCFVSPGRGGRTDCAATRRCPRRPQESFWFFSLE